MRGGGSRTGGTGDIKPQIFTGTSGTAGAVDDYVVGSLQLPVPRFGTQRSRATVFEVLSVQWFVGNRDSDTTATHFAYLSTVALRSDGDTSTDATFVTDIQDPRVFAPVFIDRSFTTSGGSTLISPVQVDLTDKNGNGIIIATDRLFVTYGNSNGSVASEAVVKILYRMVNVGVQEYIGIVQSQQ